MPEPVKTQPTGNVQVDAAMRRIVLPVLEEIQRELSEIKTALTKLSKVK